MSDILQTIIGAKRREVSQARANLPVAELMAQAAAMPPARDFCGALTTPQPRGLSVIAEIKKASPSAGLIRADFDPVTIARIYEQSGANAISVLTDHPFFQGSLDFLRQVRGAVQLPLLRKEFIIDPYQIYEARAAGADAILLIAEAFDDPAPLDDLFMLAGELGLAVLFEIHETGSLALVERLTRLPHGRIPRWLLGINNRNLKTMTVDLNHSVTVAGPWRGRLPLVSESGIKTVQDVQLLVKNGFNAVLVGETLMRQSDIALAFAELFGPPPRK